MFIKKNEILSDEKIGYFIYENNLYYSVKTEKGFLFITPSKRKYSLLNHLMHFLPYEGRIYLNDIMGNTYYIENELLSIWDKKWKMVLYNSYHSDYILCNNDENWNYKIHNLITGTFRDMPTNSLPNYIIENVFFRNIEENLIERVDNETFKIMWSISLLSYTTYQDYPIIKKFVGIYANNLWLILSSGYLLALAIDTGEQKSLIEGFPPIQNAFLDEKKEIIFHFFWGYYYQIDLKDLSFTKTDLRSQMQNERYNSTLITFDDNFLYYIDGIKGWVGVVERESLKIVWQYNFKEIHKARPIELKVSESNLYIADSNNTLHIFEREKVV